MLSQTQFPQEFEQDTNDIDWWNSAIITDDEENYIASLAEMEEERKGLSLWNGVAWGGLQ